MEGGLWFYVQSRSEASRLVRNHVAKKLGPMLGDDGEPCQWREWTRDCPADIALKKEAAELARCSTGKRPDQQAGESLSDVIYREKLVDSIPLFWLRKRSVFPFFYQKSARETQGTVCLVNHTVGEVHLTQKAMLVRTLASYFGERGYFDFHPPTFIFSLESARSNKSEPFTVEVLRSKVVSDVQAIVNGDSPRLWILKPSTGSCGRGISILELMTKEEESLDISEITNRIEERLKAIVSSYKRERSPELIVQSYIERPLLYRGYKFDYRVYLMIASVRRPFIALYTREGYLRVCSDQYDDDIQNRNAHITNFHVQRDHPLYDPTTDSIEGRTTRVEYQHFIDYLLEVGLYKDALSSVEPENKRQKLIDLLDEKVHRCIGQAAQASINRIGSHPQCAEGQFALLGVDLLLDAEGEVWLIEFTKSPAFRMQPDYLNSLHTRVLTECADIALEVEAKRDHRTRTVDVSHISSIQESSVWSMLRLSQ